MPDEVGPITDPSELFVDECLDLIRRKYNWPSLDHVEQKIAKTGQTLNLNRSGSIVFLLATMNPPTADVDETIRADMEAAGKAAHAIVSQISLL